MSQFGVFSLADVMGKADQARAMRQQEQMNEMKTQEYLRNQQEQQTLGDIMSRSITTTGGSPAIAAQPEQVMPEEVLGPPRPEVAGVAAVPGRTDFDYNKMFEQAQNLPEAMRGPLLQKLHAARATEEDRRHNMQLKMRERGDFTNYNAKVQEGASGRSDPLNVASSLRQRLGRDPSQQEVQASYRSQLPDMYAPTSAAQGALVQDRGDRSGASVRNPILISKAERDELRDVSNTYETTRGLASTFRPEYAGKGFEVLANASQWLASRKNDNSAQAQWARKYEALNNVERHKLFGAALTATELDSWNRSKASLAAGSGNMQTHLANMERMAAKVLSKTARPVMIGNYNQDSVKGVLGEQIYNDLKNTDIGEDNTKPSAWEDGQYMYRRLPDGTVQRKTK